jgi:exonuclease SbcC
MRLHRLEIEGFGPFRERQEIDFDDFAGDGLFLISGRTGAGKSSILDAITFALYGSIPRYSSGEKRLRSDHSAPEEPTEVVLEFSAGDHRYRVIRNPEYLKPKQRGEGMTTQAAAVQLARWEDGDWQGMSARARDVGNDLDEILQLSREQFLQVILLAQNRFAEFLLAGNDERRKVLQTLFGTRRFQDYADAFDARRRAAEAELAGQGAVTDARLDAAERIIQDLGLDEQSAGAGAGAGAGADAEAEADGNAARDENAAHDENDGGEPPAATPGSRASGATVASRGRQERLDIIREALPRAEYRRDVAREEAQRLTAEQDRLASIAAELEVQRQAQRRRDETRVQLATAESAVPAREQDRSRWLLAQRAEETRASLDAVIAAERRHQDSEAAVTAARSRWQHVADDEVSGSGSMIEQDGPGPEQDGPAPEKEGLTPEHEGSAPEQDGAAAESAVLRATASQASELLGALAHARKLEEEADELATQQRRAQDELTAADEQVAQLTTRLAALPDELHRLGEQHTEAVSAAAALPAARAEHERLEAALAAARLADAIRPELRIAEEAQAAASEARTRTSAALTELMRRRLDGHASELARDLLDGRACPVCGSLDHPAPAPDDEAPVSEADVTAAEDAAERAAADAQTATDAARAVRDKHAAALAAAGGLPADDLQELVVAARAASDAAEAAQSRAAARATEMQNLATARAEQEAALALLARERTERQSLRDALNERARAAAEAIAEARAGAPSVADRVSRLTEVRDAATALADSLDDSADRWEALAQARALLSDVLERAGIESAEAARAALLPRAERDRLQTVLAAHDAALRDLRAILLQAELDMLPEEPIDVHAAQSAVVEARAAANNAAAESARAESALQQLTRATTDAADSLHEMGEAEARCAVIVRLADTVAGREPNTRKMSLETFVLAAELEDIVAAANLRLAEMSSGRYTLAHTDERAARNAASGLGIEVVDAHTGRTRPATSLSGGETFLASLALALGLAEVVTSRAGGVQLDTLFIDEGFGSLDVETLDVAMRTLDELRQGGRTVGVISHVEAMQDQIPARLRVSVRADGSSVVSRETAAPPA